MKKNTLIILMALLLTISTSEAANTKISYYEKGKKLFDNKKFLDSKFYFEKDIVFNPKSENSYLYLAKIFKKQKKDNLEENNLNTVLLLNPKNEEAIYLLTIYNINKSNFLKAKELILTMTFVCEKLCSTKNELQEKLNSSQKSQ